MKTSLITLLLAGSLGAVLFAAPTGEELYKTHCSGCHDQNTSRIPPRDALAQLPATRIVRTLDFGAMMSISYGLKREERLAIANFLGRAGDDAPTNTNTCSSDKRPMAGSSTGNWNGWGPSLDNTRYQSAEKAGISLDQVRGLKLKWAFGFPGDITAFGAPTVINGTVFIGSASGAIYALDAKTGCSHWVFQAGGPVRMALLTVFDGKRAALLFGDQNGMFYSVDAATGKQIWQRRVEDHESTRLTGTAATQGGVVYVPAASWEESRTLDPTYVCCTFRGSITALRVRDGSVLWKTYMVDAPKKVADNKHGTAMFGPSGAGIWSTPTIDVKRGRVYVATGDNYSHPASKTSDAIVALELKTGKILWSQQTLPADVYNTSCTDKNSGNCPDDNGPDYDFGSSPLLVHVSSNPVKDLLVAGQKSGMVYAVDPDQEGKIVWQKRVAKGGINGGVQWGMASDGQRIYAATADAKKAAAGGVADRTKALIGNSNYDPNAGGGLTALRLDGSQAWFAEAHACDPPRPGCSPAQEAAVTAIPGVVFSGSLDGHMRGYNAEDGKVLWDFDTAREFTAVNGVKAAGGSISGAGPVVSGGMIFLNSGYPRNGGMPGNVLLAFGPE